MNPNLQTPRASAPSAAKVAVVDTARGVGRTHGVGTGVTHGKKRSLPIGVLLLLVLLAVVLIALIAGIF